MALAARVGTLITWVGEGGVRLYSAGQPDGARSDKLLWQARIALDDVARLRVVRKMHAMRFVEDAPARSSIDQLPGIEGVRVRDTVLKPTKKQRRSGLEARENGTRTELESGKHIAKHFPTGAAYQPMIDEPKPCDLSKKQACAGVAKLVDAPDLGFKENLYKST